MDQDPGNSSNILQPQSIYLHNHCLSIDFELYFLFYSIPTDVHVSDGDTDFQSWHPCPSTFQAICFYAPRWMWKNWEGGKIHALMMDLDVGICSEVEKKQKKKLLLDYLADNLKHHNWWAYRYFFCEMLAFLNVVGKYWIIFLFFL